MRHKTKLLEFMGGDDRFIKGKFYNYNQITEISGVNISTLKNRLRFKYSFDGHSLTYHSKARQNNYPVFDKKSEAVSAQWLKRRLV